tara:strand:+ start:91 stop:309 length:219 start_codon:yes stop_codon:yes gene_type:complete
MTSFFQFEAVNSITSDVNGFPAFANATIAVSVMITWNFCMFLIFGRVCGLSIELVDEAFWMWSFTLTEFFFH